MNETRQGLVLHLAGTPQPVHITLEEREAENLSDRLPELLTNGDVVSLGTADGGQFTVNFTHVATAHLGRPDPNAYGAPARGAGFGT
jgi:hypothetical protein